MGNNQENASDFWAKVCKPRFKEKQVKLLFLGTDHFLLPEIEAACRRLQISCKYVQLQDATRGDQSFIEQLLKDCLFFAPDALFTLNSFGLDPEGRLLCLLEKMQLPLISWFVDNPSIIIAGYNALVSSWATIFTWDKDSIAYLKEQGFDEAHYLPLATDPKRFHPRNKKKELPQSLAQCIEKIGAENLISFVGDSVSSELEKRFLHSHFPKDTYQDFLALGRSFANIAEKSMDRHIKNVLNTENPLQKPTKKLIEIYHSKTNQDEKLSFIAGLYCAATQKYRCSCVEQMTTFPSLIIGDENWENLLSKNSKHRLHKSISYKETLPTLYAKSMINFNCTSTQMKGALNQRAFDVLASSSFILTDYREQMENLFELEGKNKELVAYQDKNEIPELIRFYSKNNTAREKITEAGRKRVLACHTWDHRLLEIVRVMREKFAR